MYQEQLVAENHELPSILDSAVVYLAMPSKPCGVFARYRPVLYNTGRLGVDNWEASGVLDPDVIVHEWS